MLSLADNNSFIAANRTPVDRMIQYLETCFNPNDAGNDTDKANMNLRITEGAAGSCLSHSHTTQYYFVYQTLSLWREIMDKVRREVNKFCTCCTLWCDALCGACVIVYCVW